MSLTAKDTPSTFELPPEGTHLAVCYLVVDLGLQPNTFNPDKPKHKVLIGWELPEEKMTDGRPFAISSIYTISLNEKAVLRQHLEAWRGRKFTEQELAGFNLRNVLGAPCQLSIVHNTVPSGKTYANVAAVMALPKGMQKPSPVNKPLAYDTEEPNQEVLEALPEWIQNKINASTAPVEQAAARSDLSDLEDVPF